MLTSQPPEEHDALGGKGNEPKGQAVGFEDFAVEMGLEENEEAGRKGKTNDYEDKEASIIHDLYARHFVPKAGREPRKEPLVGSTLSNKVVSS